MLLLFACAGSGDTASPYACEDPVVPTLTLSEEALDFGDVPLGSSATRTVDLSNTGDVALGVTSIGPGDPDTPDFTVEVGDAACARVIDAEDPGDSGWIDEDSGRPPPVDRMARVLAPGCVVPLTVTYTAMTSSGAENALVVASADWVGDLDLQRDPLHRFRAVWLSGRTDGDPVAGQTLVGNLINAERTDLHEHDQVWLEARARPSAVTWNWTVGDGGGTFADGSLARVLYTASDVEGCAPYTERSDSIYAVITDENGNQDWAFTKITAWDEHTPLPTCDDRVLVCNEPTGVEPGEGCGCDRGEDTGDTGYPWPPPIGAAVVSLAFLRRRSATLRP